LYYHVINLIIQCCLYKDRTQNFGEDEKFLQEMPSLIVNTSVSNPLTPEFNPNNIFKNIRFYFTEEIMHLYFKEHPVDALYRIMFKLVI
jgi:hypothetical protein